MKKLTSIIIAILILFTFSSCEYVFHTTSNTEAYLINSISEVSMRSLVTVINTRRKNNIINTKEETLQGSGIIIKKSFSTYYLLTNNHVVDKGDFGTQKFSVIDCFGNEYQCSLSRTSSVDDLALMYFSSEIELVSTQIASKNPDVGEKVISLGIPLGQRNYITLGKVLGYKNVETVNEDIDVSNVSYPVLTHSCPINHGSSGGALLNYDMQLVGINFAGANDENENFAEAYAIPIEKVIEFIENKK